MKLPATHDYSKPTWGHAVTVTSVDESHDTAKVIGFGHGVKTGDYLILPGGAGRTTRYRITKWEQKRPADCWAADIEFAPREHGVPA